MANAKSGKTRRLLLRLDEEIDEFLRERAFRLRTSKNALVREALVEYYKIRSNPKKPEK
ncbi:ribbon-helix-helix protein, CopG family [bacterium]|nr:ribbon-helix-helix protein, CopG family [bacterium]